MWDGCSSLGEAHHCSVLRRMLFHSCGRSCKNLHDAMEMLVIGVSIIESVRSTSYTILCVVIITSIGDSGFRRTALWSSEHVHSSWTINRKSTRVCNNSETTMCQGTKSTLVARSLMTLLNKSRKRATGVTSATTASL